MKKIQRLLSVLLVCCMVMGLLPATALAADETRVAYPVTGGSIYFDKSTGTIVDSDSSVEAVSIPSSIDGVSVTGIGSRAFNERSSLTSVDIPSGVTSIGDRAFEDCSVLSNVIIPRGVSSIGEFAFSRCFELTSIYIPASVTSIGDSAFEFCTGLENVAIAEGVSSTSIGKYAFSQCSGLTSIYIPANITSIGDYAFELCTGLDSVTISEGVSTIGKYAFSSTPIGSVTVPASVTSIGDYAFNNCDALENIAISEGVSSIGEGAFRICSNVSAVTIPASVTHIGSGAFSGCGSSLSKISVDGNNQAYTEVDGVLYTKDQTALIACPGGKEGGYTIPSSVTTIAADAFSGCAGLTSIDIPNGVAVIEKGAFSGCASLASIDIPNSVTSIEDWTFRDCGSLTRIGIPLSVTSIGSDAFSGCDILADVYYAGSKAEWDLIEIENGNEPLRSATKFYSGNDDVVCPEILSVSPSDEYVLGPIHTIQASLIDDSGLRQVCYRYSTTGFNDMPETGIVTVSGKSTVATIPVDVAELAQTGEAEELFLEIECSDVSGNSSDSVRRHYHLDWTAPSSPVLSAVPGNFQVDLSWSIPGGNPTDLAGFKVYRAERANSDFQIIGQRSMANLSYCDIGRTAGTDYYYYVEALDENGNVSTSNTVGPVQIDVADTMPPVARITAPETATAQVEVNFSGFGSTDNVGITSYSWSFGDGSASQTGVQITHKYAQPGTYSVVLEVADAYGNKSSAEQSIVIKTFTQTGTVRVFAQDENGSSIPNAEIYFDLGTETQQFMTADSTGTATFIVPVGSHIIGGYLNGYLPDKEEVHVTANQTTDLTLCMERKNIVVDSLNVKEMNLEEITAAGIDIRDPENQHVYEFTAQLTYGLYSDTIEVVTNSAGKVLSDPQKVTIGSRDIIASAIASPTVKGFVPTVVVLDLPGKATWLKEIFDVRLTVLNQARDEFFLDECLATLNVPAGLTLLDTNRTGSSPVVFMGTIQGTHQESAEWIVRGDKPGNYNLTADFTSILREFGITVDAEFLHPIEVRDAGSSGDLVLEVIAENMIIGDTDGALRVGIRNDGDKTYNMVNLDLSNMAVLKQKLKMRGFRRVEDSSLDVLKPGETLYWDYVVPRANWETLTAYHDENFYLMDAAVKALGGDTTLKSEIKEIMPFTILADKIEITRGPAESGVPLTYVNLNKDNAKSAEIPDLTITTYRLDNSGNYQPASMQVKIEDDYLAGIGNPGGKRTVTTGADGTCTISGYAIDVDKIAPKDPNQHEHKDSASYNIRFMSSRAKPIDLPVNIYGKFSEIGSLNARVVEHITDGNGKVSYRTLDDVTVSVPDANQSGVTKDGEVRLKLITTGEHLVLLEKEGYLPIRETVKFDKDENELVFTMRKDTDPGASVITNVSTSLSTYTKGNHIVFPKGQLDEPTVSFELNRRMAEGDVFDHYIFRVRRGNEILDTVNIEGNVGFWYDYEKLEPGDITEFAMVYLKSGSLATTTSWVDSNISIAPALTALEELGKLSIDMKDVITAVGKPAINKELEWEWKEKPVKYNENGKPSQSASSSKKYYTRLFSAFHTDDAEGKEVFRQLDDLYMSEADSKWTLPFDINYELSGKFTFTVSAKHKTDRKTLHAVNAAYFNEAKMFAWQGQSLTLKAFETSSSMGLKLIARFDKAEYDWKWSVECSLDGSQKKEFPIIDTGIETGVGFYFTVELSTTETATWVLLEDAGFTQNAGWVFFPDGLKAKTFDVGGEVKGSIGLDVICKGLFSAGLWAKAGTTLEFAQDRVKVYADFGHEETIAFFLTNEKSICSAEWYISASENISNVSEMIRRRAYSLYAQDDAYTIDQGQSQMVRASMARRLSTPLISDVFLETEPLLVELDNGSTLMVYCGKSGNTAQPSALYYSIYRDGSGWSAPIVIDGNGTPDIYPSVVKTQNGAALVWNDFSGTLNAGIGAEYEIGAVESELSSQVKIAIMEYDASTDTWGPKITVNPGAIQGAKSINVRPVVTKLPDGTYLLVWISSDTLLPDETQQDLIAYAMVAEDGTVKDSGIVSSPKKFISKLCINTFDDKVVLSTICSDSSGMTNGSLYSSAFAGGGFVAMEKTNALSSADTDFTSSGNALYYLNSGCIYSYDGYHSRLLYTLPESIDSVSHLSCNDDGKLSWVTNEAGKVTIYVAELQSEGVLTQPVPVLSKQDGTITNVKYVQLGSNPTILYRYNEVDSEGAWTHSVISYQPQDGIDLSVSPENISSTGCFMAGSTIAYFVSAQDLGTMGTTEMKVSISPNKDGTNAIGSTTVYTREAGIEITVPSNYVGEPYYLVVTPLNGPDVDSSNNSALLENVFSDLSLPSATYIGNIDGNNEFIVSVRNEGQVQSGLLQIQVSDMNVDVDGTLLTVPVQTLAPGEYVDVPISVDPNLIPAGHTARFALFGHGEDMNAVNDTAHAYVEELQNGEPEPEPDSLSVTLSPGTALGEPRIETVKNSSEFALPEGSMFVATEGYVFSHWMLAGNPESIYYPGDRITITSDIALIAVWKEKEPSAPSESECNHEKTSQVETKIEEPTCSAQGIKRLDTICESCGVIISTEAIPIAPTYKHEYGEWTITKEPTGTEAGRKERACVNCSALDIEVILPSGTPEPTTYTISYDGDGREGIMEDKIVHENIPHYLPSCLFVPNTFEVFAGWLVSGRVYQPGDEVTFTSDTVIKAVWEKCAHSQQKQIPSIPSTCQSTGLSEGKFCASCGKILVTQKILGKAAHNYGEWTVVLEPTTTSAGMRQRVCEVCGDTQKEVINKLPDPTPGTPSNPGSWYPSGGYDVPSTSHSITVPSVIGGKVTLSSSFPHTGSQVVLTAIPDQGYKLRSLTVTDAKGNMIQLTDKGDGKYTFTMPNSKTNVDVAFIPTSATVFTDVDSHTYYADAVAWAVEVGITNGTGANTFSPSKPCTRGEIVTFLWRANGSPKVSTDNIFVDVTPDAFFYDAVLWAVSNGITNGTDADKFSPYATCTRGEAVTFLYRAKGSPVAGGGIFKDVPYDSFYAAAVAWAVSKGVTNGTGADMFSPGRICTRGEIVTFLFRAE